MAVVPFAGKSGQYESRGSAQVGGHYGSSRKLFHPRDHCAAVVDSEVGSHAGKLGAMHEALRENGVFNHGDAMSSHEQGAELSLHVGGKSRIRRGRDRGSDGIVTGGDGDRGVVFAELDAVAALAQNFGRGREVFLHHPVESDSFRIGGAGGHEGAGLDAVGDNGVLGASEFFNPFDGDAAGAGSFDLGTHGDEEIGKVDDFGFASGRLDDGGAFRKTCGHHDVVGSENSRAVFAAKVEFTTDQAALGTLQVHVTAFDITICSESSQAFDVKVDRTIANHATTGKGNSSAVETGQKWTHHTNGSTHAAHQFVGRIGTNVFALDAHGAGRTLHFRSEGGEDLQHIIGIGDIGHAADDDRFFGQESGG